MSRTGAALAAASAALALACAAEQPPPAATLRAGRAELSTLLEALARLEGTPLGHRAAELARSLPDCPSLEAELPGSEPDVLALVASLHCADGAGPAGLQLSWPRGQARLEVDPRAGVDARLELSAAGLHGAGVLLVPGSEPPGPAVLSDASSLLHVRLRPAGGLDLAALVPEGGQGDRMFRLKSRLFQGVVLDGTWEAAVYPPGEGEPVPRAALALGFSQRAAAVAAAEEFLDELARTWPVRRSSFEYAGAEGACLLDLRILPAFAPCYAAGERALVVGYNPASLRQALDGAASSLGDAGGLVVDFGRLAESDARLAGSAQARVPWSRLSAVPEALGDDPVRLRVRLEPAGGA